MIRQLSLLLGSTALAAMASLTAMAQEYSDGGICRRARGPAVLTPVESAGIHPPGGADGYYHHKKATFTPYYAPLSPTPTYVRWRTTCYTPYYTGYCPHRLFGPKPPPYGFDGSGCGAGPGLAGDGAGSPDVANYGPYTTVIQDDTTYWLMGGNGLVPYGAPPPPRSGPPDIVDMIQGSRAQGGSCGTPPDAAMPPPIMPRAE